MRDCADKTRLMLKIDVKLILNSLVHVLNAVMFQYFTKRKLCCMFNGLFLEFPT